MNETIARVNKILASITGEMERSTSPYCSSREQFRELMIVATVLLYKTSASDNEHVSSEIQEMATVLTDKFSLKKSRLLDLLHTAMPLFKGDSVFTLPTDFLLSLSKKERTIVYSMAIRIAHADEQLRIGEVYFLSDLSRALELSSAEKKEARAIAEKLAE